MNEQNTRRSRDNTEQRAERVPLGIKRSKLEVKDQDPAYMYRWINDVGGRVLDAQNGGYEFVTDAKVGEGDIANRNASAGNRVSRVVGTTDRGNAITAYLMRIRKEFYQDDQAAKKRQLDELDKALKAGQSKPVENSYVPTQGINISGRAG